MEENKILEFVKEFNEVLEERTCHYDSLQYITDGYSEVIVLPEMVLFSDNDSYENFKTVSLGAITRRLHELLSVSNKFLQVEIEKFFAGKRELMKGKFPKAKLKYRREDNSINYMVTFSGEYDEEQLEEFGEVVQEDFKFLFEGLRISDIWYD